MTRARQLADMISDGVIGTTELADDVITPVKLDETGSYTIAQLGIGTSSGAYPFTVESTGTSTIHIKSTATNGYAQVRFQNDVKAYSIGVDSNDDLFFYDNSNATTRILVDTSGNLGVGTSNPAGTLHLNGADTSLRLTSNQGSNTPLAQLQYQGSGGYFLRLGDSANNEDVMIRTYGDSHFNGGNVGIGDSSPDRKLHVNSGTDNVVAKFESTDSVASIEFVDSGGGSAEIGAEGNSLLFFPAGAEKMRIDSSGRVGIGGVPNTNWRNDIADQEVLMLGTEATLFSDSVTTELWNNAYIDNSNVFKNISTRGASRYFQYEGAHKWYTAASASAGSTITSEIQTTPKMTLDVSGNLLVGTTNSTPGIGDTDDGAVLGAAGWGFFSKTYSSADSSSVLYAGRNGTDGSVISIAKDGSTVGSIGTIGGDTITIGSGDTGLLMNQTNDEIIPWNTSTNAANSGAIDLGDDNHKFKDIYLSGSVAGNAQKSIVNQPTGGTAGNYWKLGNWLNVGGGDSLHIEVHSTQGYSNSAYSAGTTVIEYTRTNSGVYANAVEGVYYSTSANATPSVHDVVYVPVGGFNEYEIYVKAQSYAELAPFAKTNGASYFVPSIVNTNSTNRPNGSYANMSTTLYQYIGNASNNTTSPTRIGFTSSGNIVMASGAGIDFSATSNGSGTVSSELLDDYEKGSWTPTAVAGITGFGIQSATYTKVGRVVTVMFYVTSPTGASGSNLQIGGLPFTPATNNYSTGWVECNTSGHMGMARTNSSNTYLSFFYPNASSSVRVSLTGNDVGSSHLICSITYQT